MAKKKAVLGEELITLRKSLQDGNVVIGRDRVLKNIRLGKIKLVFIANNCPEKTKQDLQHLCNIGQCTLTQLELNNEELGVFCKKNFMVAVLGIGD